MSDHNDEYIYVSGAITHATGEERALFEKARLWLENEGYRVFIPPEVREWSSDPVLENTTETHTGWSMALNRDISKIAECTGIAILPTFMKSRGALFEIFTALTLKKTHVLLPDQHPQFRLMASQIVYQVQSLLWSYVPRDLYPHHVNLLEAPDSPARIG